MTVEQVIRQIVSTNPTISVEEIESKLQRERQKTNGLISDETLIRFIASKFGIDFQGHYAKPPELTLLDLVPSLNDITVVGRIVAVFPPKTFKGNKSGKFASFLIADRRGVLRVVLWNAKTSLIESGQIKTGQIIQISHGYTKEDHAGKVELHIGDKSEIEINPTNVQAAEYPNIDKFTMKINEAMHVHVNRRVNLAGTVKKVFPKSTFERQDSSTGKMMRLILADDTGEISMVAWNEKVDELEGILNGRCGLRVVNAKVKKRTVGNDLEAHVDSGTYTETFFPIEEFLTVSNLKEHLTHVNIRGEVTTKPTLKEVKTSKQEIVKLASFELQDETGKIWVSTWRKHAETAHKLCVGTKITIIDTYVKRGFGGSLELSTRENTSITIIP